MNTATCQIGEAETWRPTAEQLDTFREGMGTLDFNMSVDQFYQHVRSEARSSLLWDYFIAIYEYFNREDEPAEDPTAEDLEILHSWYRIFDEICQNNNNFRKEEMVAGLFTRNDPPPRSQTI